MMGDYHVRICERFGGETPPYLLDQIAAKFALYLDFRRTSKSFAAHPCNRPVAAKHMLFCLPGLRRLDNFIIP
jgi:hypothetical protein